MNIWNSYGFKWVCFPFLTWKRVYCIVIVYSLYHLPYLFELLFWQHFNVFWCFGKIIIKLLLSNITFRRFSSFMPKTIIYGYTWCVEITRCWWFSIHFKYFSHLLFHLFPSALRAQYPVKWNWIKFLVILYL